MGPIRINVAVLLAVLVPLAFGDRPARAQDAAVPFTRLKIDPTPPEKPHSKMLGDLDGDGRMDVVVAGAVDGDGDLDLVGANHAGPKSALELWRNQTRR